MNGHIDSKTSQYLPTSQTYNDFFIHSFVLSLDLSFDRSFVRSWGKVLKVSEEERDLGVIMHKSAKPSRQCCSALKKSNSTLSVIRRTIVTRDKDTILRLYK